MHRFAVVIPFYQEKSGVLLRAVQSILEQTLSADRMDIVIVDDGSPVSARSELVGLNDSRITIIEQANAGPAAARNKALDNVAPDVQFVAFLDANDEWSADHLANADLALKGADFYFADHYQLGQTVGAFARAGRINPEEHSLISGTLRKYRGDMFEQILSGNVIGISTVVYRYRKFPKLRFREAFVNAGEDYLFWLELAKKTTRFAFSTACECTYGEGVNNVSGSGWGTEKSLTRLHYEIKFKKALPIIFPLSETQKMAAKESVKALRRSFVANTLHRLARRKPLGRKLLIAHAKVDPQSFLLFAPIAAGLALSR